MMTGKGCAVPKARSVHLESTKYEEGLVLGSPESQFPHGVAPWSLRGWCVALTWLVTAGRARAVLSNLSDSASGVPGCV
jgi:hypothetical protein